MSYEQDVMRQHKDSLAIARKLIMSLVGEIETVIDKGCFDGDLQNDYRCMWGEKENVVSVLTKLTSLLVKVVPMEQRLVEYEKSVSQVQTTQRRPLASDDKEIIRRYVQRYSKKN